MVKEAPPKGDPGFISSLCRQTYHTSEACTLGASKQESSSLQILLTHSTFSFSVQWQCTLCVQQSVQLSRAQQLHLQHRHHLTEPEEPCGVTETDRTESENNVKIVK